MANADELAVMHDGMGFRARVLDWGVSPVRSTLSRDTRQAMSRENVKVVRRLWEGLERDPDMSWLALCDERMEIRNPPGFPVADEYHGHQGARRWATEVWEVFSQFHHEVQEIIDTGDDETVVSVQRLQGRMRHTQIEMNAEWATVWTLRGGKASAPMAT